ncbi:uncharacterized protein [Oryza sativa Japonica Group]|uniref:uncharacterized protein n=1 Tax=Oryza sativa subsp. japonica TaxID=39947 RepID=UPI00339D0E07
MNQPSPRRPPLSPTPPAASSRLCRLDRAPAGRAVASSSVAATSSTPACPPFRAVTAGGAFPPSPFSFLRAGCLQPPLPPRRSAVRPRRLLPRPRSHLLSLGQPSVSRGKHRRRVLAGKTVALPPLFHLRPPLSRFPCAGRRRHHLPRLRDAALIPGITSSSPEARRSGLLVGVQYLPASGRLLYVAGTPIDVAVLSSPPAAPLFRRNTVARAGLSILIVADVPSAARSSSPARRLAAPPPSSSSRRRVPHRPRIRAAAAGCPRRLLTGPGRRRRRPLVIPGRRGVRPSVEPFSSVVRISQASRGSPVLVFVLASASSSLVPAVSRLHSRIAAEVVPSPSAAPVRRCRSHASSRGGL